MLPALGELRIHECDVAQLDAYFTDLQRRGYAANTRRTPRSIVSGTMQQAVLHKAAPGNPVRELERIEESKGKRKAQPRGLTIEECRRLLAWMDGTSDDPKVARKQQVARDADLPDLIRFALGTGLRIGEACGVRICDLDLDGVPVVSGDDIRLVPIVAVRGKVYGIKGLPPHPRWISVHRSRRVTLGDRLGEVLDAAGRRHRAASSDQRTDG